jgi:hypothetical protein
MCRGQCEKQRAIWNECVAEIAMDSDEKAKFDVQMADLSKMAMGTNVYLGQALPTSEPWNPFTFPDCDMVAAKTGAEIAVADAPNHLYFGLWPGSNNPAGYMGVPQRTHINFPEHMSTEAAFPVQSSTWTHTDGVEYEVQCFIPGVHAYMYI